MTETYLGLMSEIAQELRAMGPTAQQAMPSAMRRLGERFAGLLRRELGLGATIDQVGAAWEIGCHVAGIKYRVVREDGKLIFHTPHCPTWEHHLAEGELLCRISCLPMTEGLTEALSSGGVALELVRPPDREGTCIRALAPRAAGLR